MIKSEKQKMLAGEIFDCADEELVAVWRNAKKLQTKYNACAHNKPKKAAKILRRMVGSCGETVIVSAPFFVDHGENIHIGNNVEINMNCTFLDCNSITIGDYSGIGPGVQIYTVGHPINPNERLLKGGKSWWNSSSAPVTIGRNVWIGGAAIILAGVTIGDNTTIAAGSVVVKSIPANCLAAGNPCKIIRYLETE